MEKIPCPYGHDITKYNRKDGRCGECHTIAQRKYRESPKGLDVNRQGCARWRKTSHAKVVQENYRKTEKYQNYKKYYNSLETTKLKKLEYDQTAEGQYLKFKRNLKHRIKMRKEKIALLEEQLERIMA